MKSVLAVAAAFAVVVTGGVYYTKTGSKEEVKPSAPETVQVNQTTVKGNVIDDLKQADESSFKKTNKSVLKLNVDLKRTVYFNSQFSFTTVQSAVNKLKQLEKESSDPIFFLIDSPGGSVVDGAILNAQMSSSKAPVHIVCTRLCASMAAMAHSYGTKRYALDGAILMYHPASGGAQGQLPNMVSQLKTMTRYINKMNANILSRSKLSKSEFDNLVAYEIWIDAEDALEKGLIDGIVSLDVPAHEASEMQGGFEERNQGSNTTPRNVDIQAISPYADSLWGNKKSPVEIKEIK